VTVGVSGLTALVTIPVAGWFIYEKLRDNLQSVVRKNIEQPDSNPASDAVILHTTAL
jgi:hypothetical protein